MCIFGPLSPECPLLSHAFPCLENVNRTGWRNCGLDEKEKVQPSVAIPFPKKFYYVLSPQDMSQNLFSCLSTP